MKTLVVLALMALATADDDFLKVDEVDFDSLASDIGELKKFNDCLINKGPCTPSYQTHKDHAVEAVKEACRTCSPSQKHFGHQYFELLKTKLPEDYESYKQVIDPENKYLEAMLTELAKYKTL